MVVTTPLGTYKHDSDRTTGARCFLISLDLVRLTTLILVSFLSLCLVAGFRSRHRR